MEGFRKISSGNKTKDFNISVKFHQKTPPQSHSHYQGIHKSQHMCTKKKTGKASLVLFFQMFS